MQVKTEYLVEGCITKKDIFSLTNRAIVAKNTVITKEHLNVLRAFLVKKVEVDQTLVNGEILHLEDYMFEEGTASFTSTDTSFMELFLTSVKRYKKEFTNWQAGSTVDLKVMREMMIPLLEKGLKDKEEIGRLYHYSNRDEYIYTHPVAVGVISGYIAAGLGYETADVIQIALAGLLADCGMAKIPPQILTKKESLTSDEFMEIKKHPLYGYKMVSTLPSLRDGVKIAILQHHNRLDGSGYPHLESNESPKMHDYAKIVAVSDVYHAMTTERIYRRKHSPFKVIEMIVQDDFGKFDITCINVLLNCIARFSLGDKVRLSNGQVTEVIFTDQRNLLRPIVKVIETNEVISLERKRDLHIEEILVK